MQSSHLILCRPFFLLPPIPPSIRVFSNESTLHMRWPKYWSFNFSISPSNEHPGLISFKMDWLGLLAVQGTLKSFLQHHSSKASILQCSAFFTIQLSHPYMTRDQIHGPCSGSTVLTRQPGISFCCCSVAKSCLTLCNPMDCSMPGFPVLHYLLEFAQTYFHWVSDAIQLSNPLLSPFPSAFNLYPALGSFPMSQFFTSGYQSIRVSASASVLPMNIQDWFPLEWTSLISLQSKGRSRVFSNTTVQKHQLFGAQLCL